MKNRNLNTTRIYDTGVETGLLYILFTCPEKQAYITEKVNEAFFVDPVNREIFKCAKEQYEITKSLDPVLVADLFDDIKVNERLIDVLTNEFALSVNAPKYCEIMFEKYLDFCVSTANSLKDLSTVEALKESYVFDEEPKIVKISDKVEGFMERYEKEKESVIFSYWSALDNCVGSFSGGDYIALGAATGVGKTALALNLSRQICMQNKSVLYFSLEMPLRQLQNRFVCMNENLDAFKFRSFGFNLIELQKYEQGLKNLKQWDLNIVSDFDITAEKFRTYAIEQKKRKLDFIVVDYLGLMRGENGKSLYEKVTGLSRQIKLTAVELNVPVLVLVQLNRDLKNRQDKRPVLSDIRESGAIEQDADFVMFAHREGMYNENAPKNALELIVAKNRHGGSQKTITLSFDLSTQNIRDLS